MDRSTRQAQGQPPPRSAASAAEVRRRQRLALTILGLLAATSYVVIEWLLLSARWPGLPFPELDGLTTLLALGTVSGLLIRRWWALGLPLTLLIIGSAKGGSGIWSGIAAVFVGGPITLIGLAVGVFLGRRMMTPAPRGRRVPDRAPARGSRPARGWTWETPPRPVRQRP